MLRMRDFSRIDFVAAMGLLAWAVLALFVTKLGTLLAPEMAFPMAGVCFTRWTLEVRKEATSMRVQIPPEQPQAERLPIAARRANRRAGG